MAIEILVVPWWLSHRDNRNLTDADVMHLLGHPWWPICESGRASDDAQPTSLLKGRARWVLWCGA